MQVHSLLSVAEGIPPARSGPSLSSRWRRFSCSRQRSLRLPRRRAPSSASTTTTCGSTGIRHGWRGSLRATRSASGSTSALPIGAPGTSRPTGACSPRCSGRPRSGQASPRGMRARCASSSWRIPTSGRCRSGTSPISASFPVHSGGIGPTRPRSHSAAQPRCATSICSRPLTRRFIRSASRFSASGSAATSTIGGAPTELPVRSGAGTGSTATGSRSWTGSRTTPTATGSPATHAASTGRCSAYASPAGLPRSGGPSRGRPRPRAREFEAASGGQKRIRLGGWRRSSPRLAETRISPGCSTSC